MAAQPAFGSAVQHALALAQTASTTALNHLRDHATVYVALVALVLTHFVYRNFLYARYFSPIRHMPGPRDESFLLGNMGAVIREEPGVTSAVNRWHKQYGPHIRFIGAFGRERVSLASRVALKQILVDDPYNFPKPFFLRDLLGIVAGYGLLTLEDEPHRDMRRFMNNAFAMKYLQQQFDTYYGPINSLVETIDKRIAAKPEEPVELAELVGSCLFDIICETAFGYKTDSMHNPDEPLHSAYQALVNLQNQRILAAVVLILSLPGGSTLVKWGTSRGFAVTVFDALAKLPRPIGSHFRLFADFCGSMYQIRTISRKMLKSKLQEARKLKEAGEPMDSGKVDVLSLLVKASQDQTSPYRMKEDQLAQQVLTFLGAGHETTASGASWALYELARHPHVQERLHAECAELISRSANPGWQELKELEYLQAFVLEVLRLRPPTPSTARVTKKPCVVDGVALPAGVFLWISNITINTLVSEWGEDAEQFKPERWLDLSESQRPRLMTFIQGAHSCIGKSMAQQEMLAIVAALVARFEFSLPSPDYRCVATSAITMKPKDGVELKVRRRLAF